MGIFLSSHGQSFWLETEFTRGTTPDALSFEDRATALHFLRRFTNDPRSMTALRARLAQTLSHVSAYRMSDHQVLEQWAGRLAAGSARVFRSRSFSAPRRHDPAPRISRVPPSGRSSRPAAAPPPLAPAVTAPRQDAPAPPPQPSLQVACDCHHFAPSVEEVTISYKLSTDEAIERLVLDITDRHGERVYRSEWVRGSDQAPPADRKITWDGENNQVPRANDDAEDERKEYVNPLGSPYTLTLNATFPSSSPAEGTATVKVLYREVTFAPLAWADVYKAVTERPNTNFPDDGDEDAKLTWLQYRLNDLGYVAGPIEAPPREDAVRRALFRYTQAHPELPSITDFDTLDAGPAGRCDWGWVDAWEEEYGTLEELCTAPSTPSAFSLLRKLKYGEHPRTDLVEDSAALTDHREASRIILDHDIFYLNKDFVQPDAHAEYDREFLNPFCWPLQAKALLVSKDDHRGTQPGVFAPAAVGPVACEWIVYDPPEDLHVVPPPTEADVNLKSKTRGYLDHVQREHAADYGDALDAQDNCPASLGGTRPGTYKDMSAYFEAIDNLYEGLQKDGRRLYSTFNDDAPPSENGRGMTGVLFQGSYIGGDNYVIQARLSFDHVPHGDALKRDHRELRGLSACFGDKERLPEEGDGDPLVAQTGLLTIWRRHHVLREIIWGSETYAPIDWLPIVDNFRAAHVILVPPQEDPIHIGDLFDDRAKTALAQTIATDPNVQNETKQEFDARQAEVAFRPTAMYPLPLRTLEAFEQSALKNGHPDEQTSKERFRDYTGYLTGQMSSWPTYSSLVGAAREIRKTFDRMQQGSGLVILRVEYMPKPDFDALLPKRVFKKTKKERAAFAYTRGIAVGMDYGVVVLDHVNAQKFTDSFFVSHEIGHCLFGTHPFEPASTRDHDQADQNCLMYYNTKNNGLGEGWAVREQPDRYRLSITLRGSERKSSYGTISGTFKPTGRDGKEYEFSGRLSEIESALKKTKFTPAKGLPDGMTIRIQLNGHDVHPKLSVGPLPHTVEVPATSGKTRPFEGVSARAPNLKDPEPRFCGKCVLKFRGWKVMKEGRDDAVSSEALPEKTLAIPDTPKMEFIDFQIAQGGYVAGDGNDKQFYKLFGDADSVGPGWPRGFLHRHRLTWKSSDGDPRSLSDVWTREHVRFRTDTQAPPFNRLQDPDREFYAPGSPHDASCPGTQGRTEGIDDHSTCHPALICCYPRQEGVLVAEQWYQYRRTGEPWDNIPGAAFLIEKRVFRENGDWVFAFKKTNWAPHNDVPFHFEVHYTIPDPPDVMPARYEDITPDGQCSHEKADIHTWARRVVSLG